jgi:hypothetical protein
MVVNQLQRVSPIEIVARRFEKLGQEPTKNDAGYFVVSCPVEHNHANGDRRPSLHFKEIVNDDDPNDRTVAFNCFSGKCSKSEIAQALGLKINDLFSDPHSKIGLKDFLGGSEAQSALTILDFAEAKRLPLDFLMLQMDIHEDVLTYHVKDGRSYKKKGVLFPHRLPDGSLYERHKLRTKMKKQGTKSIFFFNEGDNPTGLLYGLEDLPWIKESKIAIWPEGESDRLTLRYHGFPALGVSAGAGNERQAIETTLQEVPDFLDNIQTIYIIQEKTDQAGINFPYRMQVELRKIGFTGQILRIPLRTLTGAKDPSELHCRLWDKDKPGEHERFREEFQKCLDQAKPMDYDTGEQSDRPAVDTSTIDKAIEAKDAQALIAAIPLLAQLSKQDYLPYDLKIKESFDKNLNMNNFYAALNEQRKAIAAEAIKVRQAEESDYEYERTDPEMIYHNPIIGAPVILSNFTAEIMADVITDDGAERTRSYAINAAIAGRHLSFDVSAKDLSRCEWIDEHVGARARITTGRDMKSHFINAIKYCSQPEEQFHYAHTGWRLIDDEMVYLHASGAVRQVRQVRQVKKKYLPNFSVFDEAACRDDLEVVKNVISQVSQVRQVVSSVRVSLTGPLVNYVLPTDREKMQEAIQASLRIMDLTKDTITCPLYASVWRAPLPDVNFGLHLAGQTGWGKTELVALLQQHFGASMIPKNLPGSWESTENSLEMLLFQAKDTIVVIDDFKPKGGKNEQDRLHSKADRVFRSIGNGSGRGRLTSNLEQRVERRPRCLPISTGEDVPRGESLKARCVVLLMDERITKGEAANNLLVAQRDARNGLYAQAMAGYLEWLAPQMSEIQAGWLEMLAADRARLDIGGHGRLGTNTANLLLGMKFFLQYAFEYGAISPQQAQEYYARCEEALRRVAEDATNESKQEKPSEQWRKLIAEALASKKSHLVTAKGENPGAEYGWVKSVRTVEIEGIEHEEITYRGGGTQIGWIDGEDIYLSPAAAYSAAKAMGSATGDDITTREATLRKFLVQDNLLASTGLKTTRKTITIRRSLENIQRDVLHLRVGAFYTQDSLLSELPNLPNLPNDPSEPTPQADSQPSQVEDGNENKSSDDLTNLTIDCFKHGTQPLEYDMCAKCHAEKLVLQETILQLAEEMGYPLVEVARRGTTYTYGGDVETWISKIESPLADLERMEEGLQVLKHAPMNGSKKHK